MTAPTAFSRALTCAHRPACAAFAIVSITAGLLVTAGRADALTIDPTFDSSITRLSNASTVEQAFNAVAAEFSAAFANPVTVNITVSWNAVGGQALGSGDVSGSVEDLSGPYSYASFVNDMKANLPYNPGDATFATAVKNLPASDPTRLNKYEIPYAEAKALGLFSAHGAETDGYVGFKSGVTFDYNAADGVTAGAYDFQGLAAHEISEVLGRISGLPSSGAATFATPFDAFRYTAVGVSSFSDSASAYFSIDGGKTDLGNYNTVGLGDRGDWLVATSMGDASSAFFNKGKVYSLSSDDLTALDALGWGSWSPAAVGLTSTAPVTQSPVSHGMAAIPEPGTWFLLFSGVTAVGGASRWRRSRTPARRA